MIVKPELAHRFGIEQIAPVKHDRRRHFFFHHGKIDIGEFAPLRRNDQRLSGDVCALAQKIGHQIDGDR